MQRIFVTPFSALMVAASLWPAIAAAEDAPVTLNLALCEQVAYTDRNTPAGAKGSPRACAEANDAMAGARQIENVPLAPIAKGGTELSPERPRQSAGVADVLPEARRVVRRDMPQANARIKGGHDDEWVRLSEGPIPEPGIWAVLIAGILGIFAVARPRIFSS